MEPESPRFPVRYAAYTENQPERLSGTAEY